MHVVDVADLGNVARRVPACVGVGVVAGVGRIPAESAEAVQELGVVVFDAVDPVVAGRDGSRTHGGSVWAVGSADGWWGHLGREGRAGDVRRERSNHPREERCDSDGTCEPGSHERSLAYARGHIGRPCPGASIAPPSGSLNRDSSAPASLSSIRPRGDAKCWLHEVGCEAN